MPQEESGFFDNKYFSAEKRSFDHQKIIDRDQEQINQRAIVLGVYIKQDLHEEDEQAISENSLAELIELSETAGLEVVAQAIQYKQKPDAAYAAGSGKLKEIAELAKNLEAGTLVLDLNLSGSQMRNISELTGLRVLDRTLIILDIFALHAKSGAGRLQVEIAQLNDRAARLIGAGQALSRLGGGIGTRGPGETQLETDRRHIQRRIKYLKTKLKSLHKHRELTRDRRADRAVITVAIVGYTNAGKSTLLNVLCDSDVETLDQVFATLDPTARRLKHCDLPILLIDTVGFIRKLPHQLVDAFKSTLEEVTYADIILEVTDLSDPEYCLQMDIVEKQLRELKADKKPRIQVFNKIDLVDHDLVQKLKDLDRFQVKQMFVSAAKNIGIEALREAIIAMIKASLLPFHLLIPYEHGQIISQLQKIALIESLEYTEQGADMAFKIRRADLGLILPLLNI